MSKDDYKLGPKPTEKWHPTWGWDYLDRSLKDSFPRPEGQQNWSRLDTAMYTMSKEEIISELQKRGYNVREESYTSLFLT